MDKDITERLKELLGEEPKPIGEDSWLLILLMLMLPSNLPKEEPTINIYLGSEE